MRLPATIAGVLLITFTLTFSGLVALGELYKQAWGGDGPDPWLYLLIGALVSLLEAVFLFALRRWLH